MTSSQFVLTGIEVFDSKLGGLRRGELIVVASHFGVGKSTCLLNLARHTAIHSAIPQAATIFSLELSRRFVFESILRAEAGLEPGQKPEPGLALEVATRIMGRPLFIAENTPQSPKEIEENIIGLLNDPALRQQGLSLVLVDYLELVAFPRGWHSGNVALSEVARRLRQIAQRFQVCVVVASMMRRNRHHDASPRMADLRGDPPLSEIADTVILLQRVDGMIEGCLATSRTPDAIGLRFPISCGCRTGIDSPRE